MTQLPRTPAANALVAEVLDAHLLALEAGNAPNREALLARHPDLAEGG